ncbi:uncharacterized protein [Choristoneura fumiferana]|uniref:uncharacterized protein n=1 Tax=Choristoneura fumiferana TaxID=7141 RepID=UPI003D15B92D
MTDQMEAVKLPTENAYEPVEEARQPPCDGTMSSQEPSKPKNRHATFADDVTTNQNELSQNSSAYKEALSQPGPGLSHRHRLAWLQRRRGPGLWVQCDSCDTWRHLPHVVDAHQLPPKWYCSMNPEKSMANCSVPEAPLRVTDEEDLIHSEYSAGSLVWARLPGWPWWPAMVDDCPDTEQFYWLDGFSDIPTHYNVVFFDAADVTRAWISPENLKPFISNKKKRHTINDKKYKKRLEKAMQLAEKAEKLPVLDRLAEFSFISTYKGAIVSPRKVTKRELEKFQNQLKRKFNVDFPIEVSSESDGEIQIIRENNKRKNVILIGTPKIKKTNPVLIGNDDEDNTAFNNGDGDSGQFDNNKKSKESKLNIETNVATPMRKEATKSAHYNKKPRNIINDIVKEISKNSDSEIKETENTVGGPSTVNSNETFEQCTNVVSPNKSKHPDPDSMAIEVGSTQTINLESVEMTGIDNDSSKTYLPEDKTDSVAKTQDFQIRIESPSSDDFDF